MRQHIDLKEAEKRAFKSTHQDGIWDIFLGGTMLAFALGPLVRSQAGLSEGATLAAYCSYIALIVAAMWLAKKFIIAPRIGVAQFGPARKRKLLNMRLILTASVVLGLVMFAIFAAGESVTLVLVLGMFSVNILIVFGFMAYYMDFERLYGYALLWAISLPVGALLEDQAGLDDAGYVFFVTAGAAVVIGIVLFMRFLREYPVPEVNTHGAQN